MLPVAAAPPGAVPTVSEVKLLTPSDVAVIVTTPDAVPEVNMVVATPLAVVTIEFDKLPTLEELREKLTEVPSAAGLPLLSVIVAVIVDVPFAVIEDGVARTVMLAVAGLPAPASLLPPDFLLHDADMSNNRSIPNVRVVFTIDNLLFIVPSSSRILSNRPMQI
jgi:hypothetical protein